MKPYLRDADLTIYQGDALEVLRKLPSESIHCCVTSPPYWNLRDYGIEPTDWPEVTYSLLPGFEVTVPPAAIALGLETDPYSYVGHLVLILRELRCVLRPEATVWLNIGDTYASKARGSDRGWDKSRLTNPGTQQKAQAAALRKLTERHRGKSVGLKNKDMVGIPWLLAFALRTDGWWLRSEVIWDKANPMPESTTDRPAKAHESIFLLTKSERCFYDYVAVREPLAESTRRDRRTSSSATQGRKRKRNRGGRAGGFAISPSGYANVSGHNLRSVWKVASQPYAGAHFAVFPPNLIEPCILAGTSARGCCAECGAPWTPINEKRSLCRHELPHDHPEYRPARYIGKHEETNGGGQRYVGVVTVGWKPGCDCDSAIAPCVVIDPFMGAATTALVARKHGRHALGIELSPDYCAMAAKRLSQLSLLTESGAA